MLPRENRLRAPADFRTAFRTGVKGTSSHVLAHVARTRESHAPRVGFVVSKAVGNAVVRNRVKRRARAWAAGQLKDLRTGDLLVIRALPAASGRGLRSAHTVPRSRAAHRPPAAAEAG